MCRCELFTLLVLLIKACVYSESEEAQSELALIRKHAFAATVAVDGSNDMSYVRTDLTPQLSPSSMGIVSSKKRLAHMAVAANGNTEISVVGEDEAFRMGTLCHGSGGSVSVEGIATLKDVFATSFKQQIEETVATIESGIIFTVGESHALPLFQNFMINAKGALESSSVKPTLLHASLDSLANEECVELAGQYAISNLVCLNLGGWIPKDEIDIGAAQSLNASSAYSVGFLSCSYMILSWARTFLYPMIVEMSRHLVLQLDLDVVLHKNLLQLMKEDKARLRYPLLMGGREGNERINGGIIYSDIELLPVLKQWAALTEKCVEPGGSCGLLDQAVLNDLIKQPPLLQSVHIYNKTVLGECGVPGDYATHYNCLENKIAKMVANGHWKLDRAPALIEFLALQH